MMDISRAVIYARVSTEDQADYGTGLETQEIESRRFAERIGAQVVAIESDPGVSGTIYPRAGLECALSLIERGQANALIVHRVDRLGRKAYIPPVVFERIREMGGRLFTVEDGEVTEDNILVFSLRCGLAQTDYSRIVQNMKAGKRRLAEKGKAPIRSLSPYGYRIVRKIEAGQVREDAGNYVIVPQEAEIVRTIFKRYAAGDTLGMICRFLHEQGIPIPRPEQAQIGERSVWQPTMVSRILKNTAYKGYVLYGKTVTVLKAKSGLSFDERLNCRKPDGRKKVTRSTPEAAQIRIDVTPIVTEDLWETCQRRREENKAAGGTRNDRKHLFASLVVCPCCGRKMNSGHVNYKRRPTELRPVLYRCRDHAPSQNAANFVCHRTNYKEQDIKDAVRKFFRLLAETPEFVAAAYEHYQQARRCGGKQDELDEIKETLRELDTREKATAEAFARAIQLGARQEAFESLLTQIAADRRRLQERQTTLQAQAAAAKEENPQSIAEVAAAYARDILEVLDAEDIDAVIKNTSFRRVLREIRPIDGGFRIEVHPFHVVNQLPPVTGIVMPVR